MYQIEEDTQPGQAEAPPPNRRTRRIWWRKLEEGVQLVVALLSGLIMLRVIFRAAAANPEHPIARTVYRSTAIFIRPFSGLAANPEIDPYVLEITSLLAIAVYLFLGWIAARLIRFLFSHITGTPRQASNKPQREREFTIR